MCSRDNLDIQESMTYQISNDMGEINNTNEGHRQHGRKTTNQNPNSPTTSQRSTPSRMKSRTNEMDTRKTSIGGLDDSEDKNPPRKSLEKTHIAYTHVKRKRNISLVEINTSKV